jgi:dihydrolipoamide dehydrogenase
MAQTFDLIVFGGGPAGYKAATAAARLGAAVVLVERAREGGTCLNEGCIPSYALLHPASLIEDVRALMGRGLAGDLAADFAAAVRHKDTVVRSIRDGIPQALKRLGVTLLRGSARFAAARRVLVTLPEGAEVELEAPRVIVATGSAPRALAECPLDGETVVSSREFYTRTARLPASVLIVGGGAIGVEAAYVACQFGSRVTLAERAARLLPGGRIPEHAAQLLEERLERLGVEVRTRLAAVSCKADGGEARVSFDDGTEARYGLVLVAVGRVPASAGLNLEAIGVRTTPEGQIRTDEYLETEAKGVYAAGDVRAGPMTANAALYDAKVVMANALGAERVRANYHKVPFVVRSALEIATVGLSEAQADAAGFAPRVARSGYLASGKARARHDYEGMIEVVHDAETGQLLGGCIVGPEAGEQIPLLGAACQSPRGLWFFKDLSYSHPSWCEEIETAVDPHAAQLACTVENLFRPGIHAGG